jgi:hypothetical protein
MYTQLTFFKLSQFLTWLSTSPFLHNATPMMLNDSPQATILTVCLFGQVHATIVMQPEDVRTLTEWCAKNKFTLAHGTTHFILPGPEV